MFYILVPQYATIKIMVKFWSPGHTLYKFYEILESNKSYKLAIPAPRAQTNLILLTAPTNDLIRTTPAYGRSGRTIRSSKRPKAEPLTCRVVFKWQSSSFPMPLISEGTGTCKSKVQIVNLNAYILMFPIPKEVQNTLIISMCVWRPLIRPGDEKTWKVEFNIFANLLTN